MCLQKRLPGIVIDEDRQVWHTTNRWHNGKVLIHYGLKGLTIYHLLVERAALFC